VEKQILRAMSEDASLPVHKIAELANTTPETVRYRLKKLRNQGILLRTMPLINYSLLGYDEYILLVKLHRFTPYKEDRLRMRIQATKSIKYAFRALGRQQVFALVNTKDLAELEQSIKDLRNDFHDIIQEIKYFHITSQQRFTLFPEAFGP
jgi:DNA-binding Lrp family transcriptional regulator